MTLPKPGDLWHTYKDEIRTIDEALWHRAAEHAASDISDGDSIIEQFLVYRDEYLEHKRKTDGWVLLSSHDIPPWMLHQQLDQAITMVDTDPGYS